VRIATALLTTILAACSGGTSETKEIVIGQYGSLTGSDATFGLSTKNGIEMATEEQNAAGGIGGFPIRMVIEDDRSTPEEAATAVDKILSRDRPVALLGEVASSASLAAAPLAQAAGVPMISPSSTNPKVTEKGDYIFRVCFIDPFQGTAAAQFASHQPVTDKQILCDPFNLATFKLIEATPPAFEIKKTVALAVGIGEQVVVLLPQTVCRIEIFEILHQMRAVKAAVAEIRHHRSQP